MNGLVYKATNKTNGKVYVGITTKTLSERIFAHVNRANVEKSVFQRAIKKYGLSNFDFCVIDTANTKEELFKKEQLHIANLNSMSPVGYNLTIGGEGICKMTDQIRKKISQTKTGKSVAKLKGRVRSKEERIKISRSLNGSPIIATNIKTGEILFFETIQEVKFHGFNPGLVCMACKKNRPQHKGYFWNYANTEVSQELKTLEHRNAYQVNLSNENIILARVPDNN